MIDKLQNHYILCGFGRMGFHVARELHAENTPFIVLEKSESELEKAEELGYLHLQGDATLDESLLEAKVETALAIIAALSSDADNLYTVISAKALNPSIRAIARANSEEAVKKARKGWGRRCGIPLRHWWKKTCCGRFTPPDNGLCRWYP